MSPSTAGVIQFHRAKDDRLPNLAKLAGSFPSTAQVTAKTGPADVTINGFAFGPGKPASAPGQEVTFTNADDTSHQISITGKNQRSDLMRKGHEATLQFDEPGEFNYVRGLHPGMKGTVEIAAK